MSAFVDSKFLVCGGSTELTNAPNNTCDMFSLDNMAWGNVEDMREYRHQVGQTLIINVSSKTRDSKYVSVLQKCSMHLQGREESNKGNHDVHSARTGSGYSVQIPVFLLSRSLKDGIHDQSSN